MEGLQGLTLNVSEAMTVATRIAHSVAEANILEPSFCDHLSPGDVFDAYAATGRSPTIDNTLEPEQCGPFAAVFLHRFPVTAESNWIRYVQTAFHPNYVRGFMEGFKLNIPDRWQEEDDYFLRGLYDGIMAHAAVF